jgi:hypothetical protein
VGQGEAASLAWVAVVHDNEAQSSQTANVRASQFAGAKQDRCDECLFTSTLWKAVQAGGPVMSPAKPQEYSQGAEHGVTDCCSRASTLLTAPQPPLLAACAKALANAVDSEPPLVSACATACAAACTARNLRSGGE